MGVHNQQWGFESIYPVVIKHGWLGNPAKMVVLSRKLCVDVEISIAMFDYQRVPP